MENFVLGGCITYIFIVKVGLKEIDTKNGQRLGGFYKREYKLLQKARGSIASESLSSDGTDTLLEFGVLLGSGSLVGVGGVEDLLELLKSTSLSLNEDEEDDNGGEGAVK